MIGMTLDLAPNFEMQPAKIVVHLPWYAGATTATVDGKPAELQKEYRARWQQFLRDGLPPEQPIVSY
jgi:hypothetical protein